MPATTANGLPYPLGTDLIVNGDNDIQALARALDPSYASLTLESNFVRLDATYRNPAYRMIAGVMTVIGTWLRRGTNATVTNGTAYTVAILPTGFRPTLNEVGPTGSIGVNGVHGVAQWRLLTTGELQFISSATSGTQAAGGAWGNHLIMPTMQFRIPN